MAVTDVSHKSTIVIIDMNASVILHKYLVLLTADNSRWSKQLS